MEILNVFDDVWPEDPDPRSDGWLAMWRPLIERGHDLVDCSDGERRRAS